MVGKPADFMVILNRDISVKNIELLLSYPVVHTFQRENDVVYVLWCKSVDSSGTFVTVEAKYRSEDKFGKLQIPHWLILTIVGSKKAPAIGFLGQLFPDGPKTQQ